MKYLLSLLILFSMKVTFAQDLYCGGAATVIHANGGGRVALTAYVEASVFVGPESSVCEFATVFGSSTIKDKARVYGHATVHDGSIVEGTAHVYENALISSNPPASIAKISGNARVFGNSRVSDYGGVEGNAQVSGNAQISGNAIVSENARVFGNAGVTANAIVQGNSQVHGHAIISGKVRVFGSVIICERRVFEGDISLNSGDYCQVDPGNPIARFEVAANQAAEAPVLFDASASYDIGGVVVSYAWDFGDGNQSSSTNAQTVHTYSIPGTYLVKLTVTDNAGNLSILSKSVLIVEKPAWDPSIADFGDISLGRKETQTLALNNSSATNFENCQEPTLIGAEATGFSIYSNGCRDEVLASGEGCEIIIEFIASSFGQKTVILERMCGNTSFTAQLVANVPIQAITASTELLSYGEVGVGLDSIPQILTLSNISTNPVTGCSAPVIAGVNNGAFIISNDGCANNDLAPGANCAIEIVARPDARGELEAHIERECSVGGSVASTLQVTGVGPTVTGNIDEHDFETVYVGQTSNTVELIITNNGPLDATNCLSPVLEEENIDEFLVVSSNCGSTILNGQSCSTVLAAKAKSVGEKSAIVTIQCDFDTRVSVSLAAHAQFPLGFATSIVAGGGHSCIVLSNGSMKCWGNGSLGQLGYGNTEDIGDDEHPSSIGTVQVGNQVTQVTAGQMHTCALLQDSSVKCWGFDSHGSLGYGNTNYSLGDNEVPADFGAIELGGEVQKLASGNFHNCAILQSGGVRCWGKNSSGELGIGTTLDIGDDEVPASIPEIQFGIPVQQLALGDSHTCVLLNDGNVRCWGKGQFGQLGLGNKNSVLSASQTTNVNLGDQAVQIAAGGHHTCALLTNGSVRCWGLGSDGSLGYGTTENIGDNETPASIGDVHVGDVAVEISAGENHTCARLATGNLKCWGEGFFGRLGYGTTYPIGDNELPTEVSVIRFGEKAAQVSLGSLHSCVLLTSGGVRCWGYGGEGRLGYASTVNVLNPFFAPDVDIEAALKMYKPNERKI